MGRKAHSQAAIYSTMQLQAETAVNQPGAGRCSISMTVSKSSGQAPSSFHSPLSFDVFWSASPFWQLDLRECFDFNQFANTMGSLSKHRERRQIISN